MILVAPPESITHLHLLSVLVTEIARKNPTEGKVRVLDAGCGNGHFSSFLQINLTALFPKVQVEIYGYDIDKNKLNKAIEDFGLIPISNDELLSMDLDIFSPCALGAIINPASIKTLKCSVIAGAANNQLEKESRDSKLLLKKGIMYVPDYVINAGGLMNVANELQGYNQEKARYQVKGIYYILMRIFEYAIANNISALEAANHLAERRINEFVKWNHKWMK